ncbi:O-methyltransferase [Photobacterium galatheae]|uniref:Methyltransferase n=1 Tax=Photobacterium galatheae TaxID=1654360 RepID=A0A066S0F2_9GAMM|nr:O-methyltransferase [Photobacterium galatheae]KDM93427.1 methyltransferase [Photobacterium galatheae]MCM0147007.1 O-methyltransferase [Photobacterium galatheae]
MPLEELLQELEALGVQHDATENEKSKKLLNITRDTGEFLAVLVKSAKAEQILEIGTSNGYSTLWLASAIPESGKVVTVEKLSDKAEMAAENFVRAELQDRIVQVQADAEDFIRDSQQIFDFIFLDADRTAYLSYIDVLLSKLSSGGVLVCDNAISHRHELEDFMAYLSNKDTLTSCLLPVGKGEFVVHKA